MRHDELRRQPNQGAWVSTHGLNLNAYCGINDEIILLTGQAGANFKQGPTSTQYFYKQGGNWFGNSKGEAYLGLSAIETAKMRAPINPFPLPVYLSAFSAAAIESGWFLQADAVQWVPRGQATVARE